jgi:hypothetical protein
MIVIMTKATALNLRMTLHSNLGSEWQRSQWGFVPRSLSKLSEVDAGKPVG